MSTITVTADIDYPESDGRPMGETELHRHWTIRIHDIFKQRYRNQSVYVASDLLLYYEEGTPTKYVVPDCFVVLNCGTHLRRTFQTWKEGRVPDVVIEVTSRSTSTTDTIDKPKIYETLGVQEYFLFDPTSDSLDSPLHGYRLVNGTLREIPPIDGRFRCQTLGVDLSIRDRDLLIVDFETGFELLTEDRRTPRSMPEIRQAMNNGSLGRKMVGQKDEQYGIGVHTSRQLVDRTLPADTRIDAPQRT